MAHDVFISHCNKDKPYADAICAKLEEAGIRCWIAPRDIIPGREFAEEIMRGISEARVMVVVFSETTNQSKHVLREVERAVHKGCIIVPFRIENAEPKGAMEYFLSSPHWLDAWTPPLEQHLLKLRATIAPLIPPPQDQTKVLPPKIAAHELLPPKLPPQQARAAQPATQFIKKNLALVIFAGALIFILFCGIVVAAATSSTGRSSTASDTSATTGGSTSTSGYPTDSSSGATDTSGNNESLDHTFSSYTTGGDSSSGSSTTSTTASDQYQYGGSDSSGSSSTSTG